MTEEIKNDIDKLDGMTKIKGKCGYEIIGGCSDLRRLEQENKQIKSALEEIRKLTVIGVNASQCNCGLRALADDILTKINEVLNDI